ncbi:hypothetical protein KDL01_19115 [Actinospica durhamensis]|uniref:Uncharacterized protein n=2 Tax=Actinospica durhamensis TaxID=1508375 RepID=A0A941ISY3_9ACTN|nr:hypothetical protein [Actinospica durhamensis]
MSAAMVVVAAAVGAFVVGLDVSGASPARTDAQPGSGASTAQIAADSLWRTAPADDILPAKLDREGSEAYYRLAINPDEGCAQLPATFRGALGKAGCAHVLEATYLDSTESVVVTLGVVVVGGTAPERSALFQNWTADSYARQYPMMPAAFPVASSQASSFHDAQRIAWKSAISEDGDYLTFAVAGFADGRQGPTAAAFDLGNESELQSDSPPVQAADDLSAYLLTSITALEPTPNGSTS